MSKGNFLPSRKAVQVLGVCQNTLRTWEQKNLIEAIKTPSGQRLYNVDSFINLRQQIILCFCFTKSCVLFLIIFSLLFSKRKKFINKYMFFLNS